MKSQVVLLRCESYDENTVYERVRQGLELLGGLESLINLDERVLFKVNNLASSRPEEAVTTHPLYQPIFMERNTALEPIWRMK
ncbi:hypothetical protein [Gracilinema caldarium]|uniref:Uncharacterized protein n=1 Tax=Gracilinema caldarium (strain ATCC 51460 / DSM 7334 / H1) TaxID=744872 RepID=F8F2D7_GRAC1|nr:hypothetical protein [Gracilinema caldarium]AEJ20919.1 hypothetical protein Spica_2825 [Gracilinema caldarium DSM 7334]